MTADHKTTPLCEPNLTAEEFDGSCPFIVEFFMVRGAGFRCMAYRDANGKWRSAYNNEELPGDICILE
jgi:hypothetical protein